VEEKGVRRVAVLKRRTRDLEVVVAEILGLGIVAFGREDVLGFDTAVYRGEGYVVVVECRTPCVVPDGRRGEVRL